MEEGEDWFRFDDYFSTQAEGEQSIPAYRALLNSNGFREAGQYPDKSNLYKKIDGKCYHVDTEHCFEGSMDRPEIWFNIAEPYGEFDAVSCTERRRIGRRKPTGAIPNGCLAVGKIL